MEVSSALTFAFSIGRSIGRPEHMRKLMIVVLKKDAPELVRALHELGTVQFKEPTLLEAGKIRRSASEEQAEHIAQLHLKFKNYLGMFPKPGSGKAKATKALMNEKTTTEQMVRAAEEVSQEIDRELNASLLKDVPDYGKTEGMRTGTLESHEKEIMRILELGDTEKKEFHELFEKAANTLKDAGSTDAKKKNEEALSRISGVWYADAVFLEERLRLAYDEKGVFSKFGETESTTIIEGWVPESDFAKTCEKIMKHRGFPLELRKLTKDKAPTKLRNIRAARPFEELIRLIGVPKEGGIDPTLFLAITFPLFYGMMLGDAGYGLLILLMGALALKAGWIKKKSGMGDLARIIMISSAFAIVFGFMFGEFFGDLGHTLFGMKPLLFERTENVQSFLLVALGIGIVHISLGIILGFAEELAEKGIWHAVCSKLSWLVIEAGLLLLTAQFVGWALPEASKVPAIILTATGFLLLLVGEGAFGILEMVSFLSNILSYTRLVAVGLASAYLPIVVNQMAGMVWDFKAGFVPVGILFALLIGLAGHSISITLGILASFIHSARLHYVEFFGKFYESGGDAYKPFAAQEAHDYEVRAEGNIGTK